MAKKTTVKYDIDIIVPIHKFDEETEKLLTRALESVPSGMKVILSTTSEVAPKLADYSSKAPNGLELIVTSKDDNGDFSTLVNNGVENVEQKYFSILEFDDEYSPIWFNNVKTYMDYKPEVSVFLPLNDLVDFESDTFVGYGNEAVWASSFSNEIGYIDNDCLQQFFDFYMTGGVFNKDDFNTVGKLKPSIKLSFWYEFLLRLTNKGKKVFVIPKIGYQHNIGRKGSLFDNYRETLDEKESRFWLSLARKECFFTQDRKKEYNPEEEEDD